MTPMQTLAIGIIGLVTMTIAALIGTWQDMPVVVATLALSGVGLLAFFGLRMAIMVLRPQVVEEGGEKKP